MALGAPQISTAEAHYGDAYYEWQSTVGDLSGILNARMFRPYIRPGDAVLDFGCGGGFLLASIRAARKLGVDINPSAREHASRIGIDTVAGLAEVADGTFDVAISCHALEHTEAPLEVLRAVRAKIRPRGRAVFVVPCERYDTAYKSGNIDQHLYTWSPMNIGNLFHHAGFEVESVRRIVHRWPPGIHVIYRLLGSRVANVVCLMFGWLRPNITQIRVVARR
jgi:SAM-dependent methyltransferase